MNDSIQSNAPGVYSIVHQASGRIYVGSSFDMKRRWYSHKHRLRKGNHPNKILQNYWNKYGEATFEFSVLEVVADVTLLCDREDYWIEKLGSLKQRTGFNIRPKAASNLGFKHSLETKARMKAARAGQKLTPSHKAALRASLIGREYSPETRRKMRDSAVRYSETSPKTKIKDDEVLNVFLLFINGMTAPKIAKHYGVHPACIANILSRYSHKHIELSPELEHQIAQAKIDSKRGSRIENSKLKEEDIPLIRRRLENAESCSQIARDYKVFPQCISRIKRGISWTHVQARGVEGTHQV